MTVLGPGQFAAQPGERLTVAITKSIAPYSATTSDLIGGVWSPPPDDNGTLCAEGGFEMPANPVSFGLLFNFVPGADPDSAADFYTVTVAGSNGGALPQTIFGPGFTTRNYFFQTV